MTQSYPILEISGDFFNDGTTETAIFEMPSATVSPGQLTAFLARLGGGGGVTGAVLAQVTGQSGQIAIDGGAGPRVWELEWSGWTDSDGYQWGTDSSPGLSETSATGQDRISQAEVFNEFTSRVTIGSNNPAKLYYGEHSSSGSGHPSAASSGVYDPVDVMIQEPSLPVPKEESSIYEASLTCVSVVDVTGIVDGSKRTE